MAAYKNMSKEEKAVLEAQYRQVWTSEDMVSHCVRSTSNYFTAGDGTIVTFDKPSIETTFWFGEHNHEDRSKEAARAKKSVKFFISSNMNRLRTYKERPDYYRGAYRYPYIKRGEYIGQASGCALGYIVFADCRGKSYNGENLEAKGYRKLTESEIQRLYEAEDRRDALFMRRLESYLKRYGLSKVHCSTYWADR